MVRSGRQKLGAILLLAAALSALGILFAFDPRRYHFYPLCLFHQTTGWLCPGCGGLRALHQLLHGHLALAFRFNPLLLLLLAFLLAFGAASPLRRLRKDSAPGTNCPRAGQLSGAGAHLRFFGARTFLSAGGINRATRADKNVRAPMLLGLWLLLAASIVFSIWRNVPGSPFALPPN